MREFLKGKLLGTTSILEFDKIIWKERIPKSDWQGDIQIMAHYEYLNSLVPEYLNLSEFSIGLKKKQKTKHSN